MEKRYIIIYVTNEYSQKADKINSYIYEYENHNLELKNLGSKQMLLVSKKKW